jgi:hypothetical protein
MSQQKLDLFEIAAIFAAQLGTRTTEVMRSEVFNPNLLG